MPEFAYKARDSRGVLVQGFLPAESMNAVRVKLSEQGLIPISVSSAGSNTLLKLNLMLKKKVKPEELVIFTKQFYTLFRAGMGMEVLLSTLAKQAQNSTLQEALEAIRNDVQQGMSLAKAFGKHPAIFNELYISMLTSGEEAGILEEVLKQLADVIDKEVAMNKGIKSAMLYPKIVIGVLVLASVVLMTVVIPKFQSFFASFKKELPLPTRLMIWCSNFMTSYFPLMVGMAIALKIMFNRYYATPKGKLMVDRLKFRMFVFGPLALKVCNARFANILSSLYRSGLPVTKALAITANTIGNEAYARDVKILMSQVELGHGIADSMRQLTYFSPVIVEATAIGERTGALDEMLKSISEHFEMEINHTVKNLTTLLEPLLLVVIFGMVTLFALAIFLPIWGMSQAALGK